MKRIELTLSQAIRELRLRLGITQQEFSNRLGLAIATAVRYEHDQKPRAETSVQMANLAAEHGWDDLATVLNNAVISDLGEFAFVYTARAVPKFRKVEEYLTKLAKSDPLAVTVLQELREGLGLLRRINPYLVPLDKEILARNKKIDV